MSPPPHGVVDEELPSLRCQQFIDRVVKAMRDENAAAIAAIQKSANQMSETMARSQEKAIQSSNQLDELKRLVLGDDGLRDMARDSVKFRQRYQELQIESAVLDMAKYIEESRKAHVLGESFESRRFRAIFIWCLAGIGAFVMATGGYFFNAAMTARDHIHDQTIHVHQSVKP